MSQEMPRQLVVLSRGLELSGQPTQPTRENALSAAYYFKEYGADRVAFAGGLSFLSGNTSAITLGEHLVMAEIAEAAGLPSSVIRIPEPSGSTVTNLITSIPLLRPQENVGLMAHGDHLPRGLFLGNLILANPRVVGVEAFGLYSSKDVTQEKILLLTTRLMFAGVSKGDLEQVKKRNAVFEATARTLKPVLKMTMLNHTPYNM